MKELIVKVKNLVIGFSLSEEKSITIRTDIRKHANIGPIISVGGYYRTSLIVRH